MTAENNEFNHRDGVTLVKYVDEINDAHCAKCITCRKGIDDKFTASSDAASLARQTNAQKFETVNEWRTTYSDLVEHKVDRNEYNESHRRLEDGLARTEASLQAQIKTTAGNFEKDHEGVAANLNQLNLSEATLAGKASQKYVTISMIFSCLTILISIFALILVLAVK